jgi:hypothetical protein
VRRLDEAGAAKRPVVRQATGNGQRATGDDGGAEPDMGAAPVP